MRINEGVADRAIRILLGLSMLLLLAIGPVPGWGLIGLVGLIPFATGLLGFCPTYTLFGIDTLGGKPRKAREA